MSIILINEAVDLLQKGEPVALPTETVYGLAAPIKNLEAIKRVFTIKERPLNDPLIVHILDLNMAIPLVKNISSDFKKLANHFWPGPLTLITNKNPDSVDDLITSNQDTVALRAPQSDLFLKAIKEVGPLAAPSANLFKKVSPSKAEHVLLSLPKVSVVDGGACNVGIESTIFNVDTLEILRPGMITISEISNVLGKTISSTNKEKTPGFEKDHYQPNTKLIVYKDEKKLAEFLNGKTQTKLDLNMDPSTTAHSLYDKLRSLDASADYITVKWSDAFDNERWHGIKNRLEKASSYWIG